MKYNNYKSYNFYNRGFTLIELLIVIVIIGILIAISFFAIQGARESSRDAKRKTDLELIRSGLEIYKSDCFDYPSALSSPLLGDGTPANCAASNSYISQVPNDPLYPARGYVYFRNSATTYEVCSSLEQGVGTVTCGGSSNCGTTCNYRLTNP